MSCQGRIGTFPASFSRLLRGWRASIHGSWDCMLVPWGYPLPACLSKQLKRLKNERSITYPGFSFAETHGASRDVATCHTGSHTPISRVAAWLLRVCLYGVNRPRLHTQPHAPRGMKHSPTPPLLAAPAAAPLLSGLTQRLSPHGFMQVWQVGSLAA